MEFDRALLESASDDGFITTMRFFHFRPAALTIGRFQDLAEIDLHACREHGIEVARRPTGGKAILHLDDFTYSMVLPAQAGLPENTLEAYAILSRGIILALQSLGLNAAITIDGNRGYKEAGGACFAATTGADLKYEGRKICGSAQLRRHGALLQHGSILLKDHSQLLFKLLRFQDSMSRELARERYESAYLPLNASGLDVSWQDIALAFQQGFSEAFNIQWGQAPASADDILGQIDDIKRGGLASLEALNIGERLDHKG